MAYNPRYSLLENKLTKFSISKQRQDYSITFNKQPILGEGNKTYANFDRSQLPGDGELIAINPNPPEPRIPFFPSLRLKFDNVSNATTLIGGDIFNVENWNIFFEAENLETKFLSVSVDYIENAIDLFDGTDIRIPAQAFKDNPHIISVIDTSYAISLVEEEAFLNCANLVEVNLPFCREIDGDEEGGTFENCPKLETVILTVCTNLSVYYTFKDCVALKNISLFRFGDFDSETTYDIFGGISGNTINLLCTEDFYLEQDVISLRNNNTVNFFKSGDGDGANLFTFATKNEIEYSIPGINEAIALDDYSLVNEYLTGTESTNWNINRAVIIGNTLAFYTATTTNQLAFRESIFENIYILEVREFLSQGPGNYNFRYVRDNAFKGSLLHNFRPSMIEYIGSDAFRNCNYIKFISALQYVSYIGDYAFHNTGNEYYSKNNLSLEISTFNQNFQKYIGTGSFSGSMISSISMGYNEYLNGTPRNPNWNNGAYKFNVGPYAFKDSSISSASIQLAIFVGDSCFENCQNLTSIDLSYCDSLGSTAGNNQVFSGISLNSIKAYIQEGLMYVDNGNPDGDLDYLLSNNTVSSSYTSYYENPVFFPAQQALRIMFRTTASLRSFFNNDYSANSINSVLKVSGSAIDYLSIVPYNAGLGLLLFDGGAVSLSSSMFAGNTDLLRFEDRSYSIMDIGENAFNGCTNLKSAYVGTAVNFGSNAFKDCVNLNTVDVRSMHIISASAFENCNSITTLYSRDLVLADNNAFKNMTSLTSVDFPALTTIGNQGFSGSNNLTYLNIPSLVTVGSTTGDNEVFSVTGKNIALTITGSLLTEGDVSYLMANNTVTLDYPALILTFDSASSVTAIVTNPNSVSDWNTFFNLPTNGTPFTSVQLTDQVPLYQYVTDQYPQDYGYQVKLYGGKNMTISAGRFQNYRKLRKLIDNGSTVVRVGTNAFRQNNQFWYTGASDLYGMMEISLPACTFLETFAFFGNFECHILNMPQVQFLGGAWVLGSNMAWEFTYSPPRPNYSQFIDQIVSLPNVISIASTAVLGNAFQVRSFNLPKQTFIQTFTFAIAGWSNTINIPEATGLNPQTFWSLANYPIKVNMPKMVNLGGSPAFNNIWSNNQGPFSGAYRFPTALMTINAGAPDGDVQKMIDGNVRRILV